ncbi:hypothetical protein KKA14_10095 [bacterium]|nr:hypothetical protein [bacterium]
MAKQIYDLRVSTSGKDDIKINQHLSGGGTPQEIVVSVAQLEIFIDWLREAGEELRAGDKKIM